MKQPKLIFFPFAGGNSNSFRELEIVLSKSSNIECQCVEYPGRGRRTGESLINNLDELVDDLFVKYSHLFVGEFYFLGYSMGAIVAQLMTKKLAASNLASPNRIFVMACRSPKLVASNAKKIAHLSNSEFIQHIIDFGGVHEEIKAHEGLLEYLSPIIRSDYQAYEGFEHADKSSIQVPIHVFGGDQDEIKIEELLAWDEETNSEFEFSIFSGNHFFLFDNIQKTSDTLIARMITDN